MTAAGFGELRDDNDANCTYEGDNNVLLQQTSNWLLNIWSNPAREDIGQKSPLKSLSFLTGVKQRLTSKFQPRSFNDLNNPKVILDAYKWLLCWLLQSTTQKLDEQLHQGMDSFSARNLSQVYYARTLSIVYIEHYVLETFWDQLCNKPTLDLEIKDVLINLLLLFGYWSLEKHLTILYQGGYISGPSTTNLIHEFILELCSLIKDDSVSLVDSLAPPDFILHSALGMSDGNIYKNLYIAMTQTPGCFERPNWWKDSAIRLHQKSKL